jgi:hypothetical protein
MRTLTVSMGWIHTVATMPERQPAIKGADALTVFLGSSTWASDMASILTEKYTRQWQSYLGYFYVYSFISSAAPTRQYSEACLS